MPIRIIIFEDNDKLRESLAYLLKSQPEYEMAGDYNNCKDAATITRVYQPDVLLLSILPDEEDCSDISGFLLSLLLPQLSSKTHVIIIIEHIECIDANWQAFVIIASTHLSSIL
jgi:DNA-binding NarL/FixJ family response regulator